MTDEEKKAKRRAYSRAYAKAHRKEINAKQRAKYAENPEKFLAACRKWQAENQDYMKAYRKAYAFTHARKARKATAKWKEENREYSRLYSRLYGKKRYAIKKGDFKKAEALDYAMKQLIAARKAGMKIDVKE